MRTNHASIRLQWTAIHGGVEQLGWDELLSELQVGDKHHVGAFGQVRNKRGRQGHIGGREGRGDA